MPITIIGAVFVALDCKVFAIAPATFCMPVNKFCATNSYDISAIANTIPKCVAIFVVCFTENCKPSKFAPGKIIFFSAQLLTKPPIISNSVINKFQIVRYFYAIE